MTSKTVGNIADGVILTTSTLFSLTDIESMLSLVILCVNVIYVIAKCCFSIYQKIKDKKYDEVLKELEEAKEELNQLKKEGGDDYE